MRIVIIPVHIGIIVVVIRKPHWPVKPSEAGCVGIVVIIAVEIVVVNNISLRTKIALSLIFRISIVLFIVVVVLFFLNRFFLDYFFLCYNNFFDMNNRIGW